MGQVYQRRPKRMTMYAALVFSFLCLIVATRFRVLIPAYDGLVRARDLYVAERQRLDLERENTQLQAIYAYLQTPEGQELAARGKVYAVKPGERLLLVEDGTPAPPRPLTLSERLRQRLEWTGDSIVAGGRAATFVARAMLGRVDAPTSDRSPPKKAAAHQG
jgi:hypothetical protein